MTDTFTTRVYPRNEFVHTSRIKTKREAVTAPYPAWTQGQSIPTSGVFEKRRTNGPKLQGSNIFFWHTQINLK